MQLPNPIHYRLLKSDPTVHLTYNIMELHKDALEDGWIDHKEYEFLNKKDQRIPALYSLPQGTQKITEPLR